MLTALGVGLANFGRAGGFSLHRSPWYPLLSPFWLVHGSGVSNPKNGYPYYNKVAGLPRRPKA